ncbi:MAG: o-succinylbenzoate synthase [Pyrinomonadaceae bacterium]|nr:o-succinylbenzoate synthase [Pyrinomonadaceae bacterium]MCX7638992.1 o-succinylbenzoate synthase [Pyrinomonadaceae bacterium]MDW8303788.1 o-succinylbenzoate synthase [Acidobacteriota bacterium]
MRIEALELIEINMPLVHFFQTSFGKTSQRRIILVRVVDQNGAEGWGECTAGETPSYCEEWTESCWITIEKILAPMILGKEIPSAEHTWDLMQRVRGNRMAKAAIETAIWDLEAKILQTPLWRHLGGARQEIPCGVSIGIQNSLDELLQKIQKELEAGYQRIKVKIAPGWDFDVIKKIRDVFGMIPLMGDANSAYSLNDSDLFKKMDEFELMMFEQPLAYDDIIDHSKLQKQLETPICLDESIRSPEDARKAIEIGSCRIINIKNGRVGGHKQSKLIESICRNEQIPVWCGGMLESGIGRAHNIAMSTLEGFTLPGDVSASKRYWHEDIIEPEVEVTAKGTIIAPETPGIGFSVRKDRIEKLAVRKTLIRQ